MPPINPVMVIRTLEAAITAAMAIYKKYQDGEIVMAENEARAIHELLLKAIATTESLRVVADAALDRAIARGD